MLKWPILSIMCFIYNESTGDDRLYNSNFVFFFKFSKIFTYYVLCIMNIWLNKLSENYISYIFIIILYNLLESNYLFFNDYVILFSNMVVDTYLYINIFSLFLILFFVKIFKYEKISSKFFKHFYKTVYKPGFIRILIYIYIMSVGILTIHFVKFFINIIWLYSGYLII